MTAPLPSRRSATTLVVVAALGYFVDVYDLILFGVIRNPSLKGLGFTDPQDLLDKGVTLFNYQMAGMLLGGILWGVLGDKRGRLSVLFGSILMYSLANIANGYVVEIAHFFSSDVVSTYAVLRLVAGIGLAGELGAGVTLVNEAMSRENRGYGTMVIVSFGPLGAITAALVGDKLSWETAYIVGGVMGLVLLLLRVGTFESSMFKRVEQTGVHRGDFLSLFTRPSRLVRYLKCILIGVPIWYVISILILFAPEIAKNLGVVGEIKGSTAVICGYIGLSIGDFANGYMSQLMRSRKKPVLIFTVICSVLCLVYLNLYGVSAATLYAACIVLGTFGGTWAMFVTMSSEQFGTNLRATVTTTVPNFVRGAVIPITEGFRLLAKSVGLLNSAMIVAVVCYLLAFWAIQTTEETFGKDLDYIEQ